MRTNNYGWRILKASIPELLASTVFYKNNAQVYMYPTDPDPELCRVQFLAKKWTGICTCTVPIGL
jgi:hypothetical protein